MLTVAVRSILRSNDEHNSACGSTKTGEPKGEQNFFNIRYFSFSPSKCHIDRVCGIRRPLRPDHILQTAKFPYRDTLLQHLITEPRSLSRYPNAVHQDELPTESES